MFKENMPPQRKSEQNTPSDEPNEVTYAAMDTAEKDRSMFGPFDCIGELMEELNS